MIINHWVFRGTNHFQTNPFETWWPSGFPGGHSTSSLYYGNYMASTVSRPSLESFSFNARRTSWTCRGPVAPCEKTAEWKMYRNLEGLQHFNLSDSVLEICSPANVCLLAAASKVNLGQSSLHTHQARLLISETSFHHLPKSSNEG